MAVYDVCPFLNENDIFEIRLNEHWDFVDKFIVVEAGERHTGAKKPFNFDHERFKPYAEKIIYVKFDSFEEEIAKYPELNCPIGQQAHAHAHASGNMMDWIRDHFQFNYTAKVLQDIGAKDDDIVYMSPLDEILNKDAFYKAMERFEDKTARFDGYEWAWSQSLVLNNIRPIFCFHMHFYVYKFNLKSHDLVSGHITEVGNLKIMLPSTLRSCNVATHPHIENGGWHFSYADPGDGDRVLEKHRSWAHSRDPLPAGGTRFQSETKEDALSVLYKEFKLSPIPIAPGTHPQYLLDNLEKYKDYIFKI